MEDAELSGRRNNCTGPRDAGGDIVFEDLGDLSSVLESWSVADNSVAVEVDVISTSSLAVTERSSCS